MEKKYIKPQFDTFGLVAHYKLWAGLTSTTVVFDYSLNGLTGVPQNDAISAYPGFSLDGTGDSVDVGTGPSAVSTVALWVKPTSVAGTDSLIDLNGTDFLTIVTGTLAANGFTGGTTILYTDGVSAATTVTAGNWFLVGITDTSAKNATDFDIGRETANFFTGSIGEVWLYSDVKSAVDMKNIFELTKWRYPNN